MRVAIITVSDRSSRGEREDLSGPMLVNMIEEREWQIHSTQIIPDEIEQIKNALNSLVSDELDIILTTGGTGFAKRDITPEATNAVIDRKAPGLAEAMRQESLKITGHAMLSRAVAGIKDQTLIINLPGSPKAAKENLEVIINVLPHAIQLLQDDPKSEEGH